MHQYPCARVELDQEEKVTENNRNTNQRWDYLYLHFCLPQRVFVTGDYNPVIISGRASNLFSTRILLYAVSLSQAGLFD